MQKNQTSKNRVCPNCNATIGARAKFCPECGQRLAITCPDCGTEIKPNAKFCPECGRKIK